MNVTVYLHEPILVKAKERAKIMGISLSKLVETGLKNMVGVNKKQEALDWIIKFAESGKFAGQFADANKFIKEERKRAERDFL